MGVNYEWDAESVDEHGDIEDHFTGTLEHVLAVSPCAGCIKEICLVRHTWTESEGITDHTWAYIVDGKLPEFFEDGEHKVPRVFHRQLGEALTVQVHASGVTIHE